MVLVGNGREALKALERQAFDLVLMDVQMPEMDGFEATAAIRQKEATTGQHLPILAMTAHALQGDRERCLAAGMDGYLPKPLRIAELLATIEDLGASKRFLRPRTDLPPTSPGSGDFPVAAQEEVDWTKALAQVGGDRELLRELAGVFLDEYRSWLGQMRAAIETRDAHGLRMIAHSLGGALRPFAAQSAREAALRPGTDGTIRRPRRRRGGLEQPQPGNRTAAPAPGRTGSTRSG